MGRDLRKKRSKATSGNSAGVKRLHEWLDGVLCHEEPRRIPVTAHSESLDPELLKDTLGGIQPPSKPLSAREFQVCVLYSRFRREKEIAARLKIYRGSVASYLSRACAKLGLGGHDELLGVVPAYWRWPIRRGAVSPPPHNRHLIRIPSAHHFHPARSV